MPLFFFGGDDTLDPTRLAMLPLRPRPLITALLTSSLVGVGPLFTLLVGAGFGGRGGARRGGGRSSRCPRWSCC